MTKKVFPMEHTEALFREVLLVEDEAAHALLIERALKGLAVSITKCASVRDASVKLKDQHFDLVVSDLNLPDVRGEAVVTALGSDAPKTPIIVLTSSASVTDGVAAMRAGAKDFLVKNFDATFRDVLQVALSRLASSLAVEREKEQITRDRDLLREAIENSNDGLAVVQGDGAVRYANSGFENFLAGFDAKERGLFAIDPTRIVRGDEVMSKLREQFASLEPGAVWTVEMVEEGDDRAAFDLSVSAVKDVGADRVFLLWVRDVRERRRRERFQREILSTTTHDLKGPLGAIAVSCDVLLDTPPADNRVHSMLERISSSASSAIQLIEEFLSLRRIEEGAFVLRPATTDVRSIVSRIVENFQLSAKTRGVELVWSGAGDRVDGCIDALGFERVLSNLISNGIKFTPKGGRVFVGIKRNSTGLTLSVRDLGAGMEPSDARRLFNRYGRLASHTQVSGTGLGLFIVKCIVSAHGGSIDVTSALGKGTTFDVYFPDRPPLNDRGEVLCLDFA
jgi:PAS domain S-box-containing protein